MTLLCLLSVPGPALAYSGDEPLESASELITLLQQGDVKNRRRAAELLATAEGHEVIKSLKMAVSHETEREVLLALHYALAAHGNKKSVVFLIDSLTAKGHLGARYLEDLTGRPYGWEQGSWRDLLDSLSPGELTDM